MDDTNRKPRVFSFFGTRDVVASGEQDITLTLTTQYKEQTKVKLQQVTGYRETDDVTISEVKLNDLTNPTLTRLFQNAVQTSYRGNRIPADDDGTLDIHGTITVTVANADGSNSRRASAGLVLKEIIDE